ncbi:hypothetical protein KCF3NO3_40700 [Chryseobacterium sp. KCF3-3]
MNIRLTGKRYYMKSFFIIVEDIRESSKKLKSENRNNNLATNLFIRFFRIIKYLNFKKR